MPIMTSNWPDIGPPLEEAQPVFLLELQHIAAARPAGGPGKKKSGTKMAGIFPSVRWYIKKEGSLLWFSVTWVHMYPIRACSANVCSAGTAVMSFGQTLMRAGGLSSRAISGWLTLREQSMNAGGDS